MKTRITVKDDQFKSVTSSMVGHNLDIMAFNIWLIAARGYTQEAKQLQEIYERLPLYVDYEKGEVVHDTNTNA